MKPQKNFRKCEPSLPYIAVLFKGLGTSTRKEFLMQRQVEIR